MDKVIINDEDDSKREPLSVKKPHSLIKLMKERFINASIILMKILQTMKYEVMMMLLCEFP